MDIFALQNIKIRLWQAVKILKGYWSFTIRNQKQVGFRLLAFTKKWHRLLPLSMEFADSLISFEFKAMKSDSVKISSVTSIVSSLNEYRNIRILFLIFTE